MVVEVWKRPLVHQRCSLNLNHPKPINAQSLRKTPRTPTA